MAARILIVDDDQDIHALLLSTLKDTGSAADCASSGEQALAFLQSKEYDLVLSDVMMPGIDGLELLHRIQQQRPGMPVVVMTARNTSENLIRSIRERAYAYFSKPFSPEDVVQMVNAALEKPRRSRLFPGPRTTIGYRTLYQPSFPKPCIT